MKKKDGIFKVFVLLLPFLSAGVAYFIYYMYMRYIYSTDIKCMIKLLTGYDCPSCGMTRSAVSLTHGEFIMSLRYNPFTILAVVYFIILYIELLHHTFSKKDISSKRIPASRIFLYISLIILFVYYVLRNFVPAISVPA